MHIAVWLVGFMLFFLSGLLFRLVVTSSRGIGILASVDLGRRSIVVSVVMKIIF